MKNTFNPFNPLNIVDSISLDGSKRYLKRVRCKVRCQTINCRKWKESHPARTGIPAGDKRGPWWNRAAEVYWEEVYREVHLYTRMALLWTHIFLKIALVTYLFSQIWNWISFRLTGVFVNVLEEESVDLTSSWKFHDGQSLKGQHQHKGSPLYDVTIRACFSSNGRCSGWWRNRN